DVAGSASPVGSIVAVEPGHIWTATQVSSSGGGMHGSGSITPAVQDPPVPVQDCSVRAHARCGLAEHTAKQATDTWLQSTEHHWMDGTTVPNESGPTSARPKTRQIPRIAP